jgi:hypothetical protein
VTAALLAGPWFWDRRADVFDYLVGYGYGERAEGWGDGAFSARAWLRIERLTEATGLPGPLALLALAIVGCVAIGAWRGGWRPPGASDASRAALGLLVVAVLGFAALVTSRNEGVWFELPIGAVVVVGVFVAVARAPRWAQALLVAWVVGLAIVGTALVRIASTEAVAPGFADYDVRFDPKGGADHDLAVQEWSSVNQQLTDELRTRTDAGLGAQVTMSGNMFMVNVNSVALLAELDGWRFQAEVPDTLAPAASWEHLIAPEVGGAGGPGRVVVVVRHQDLRFTPDMAWEQFDAAVRASGWLPSRTIPLPTTGDIVIYEHPDG